MSGGLFHHLMLRMFLSRAGCARKGVLALRGVNKQSRFHKHRAVWEAQLLCALSAVSRLIPFLLQILACNLSKDARVNAIKTFISS